jgi:hypothetical protein
MYLASDWRKAVGISARREKLNNLDVQMRTVPNFLTGRLFAFVENFQTLRATQRNKSINLRVGFIARSDINGESAKMF